MSTTTLIYIAIALAVGFLLGLRQAAVVRRSYQNLGETLVAQTLQTKFSPPDYHLLNHVTLQMEDGTTQIDHILVSRFGVFVIETKDYKGWIFANASSANWTQVLFNAKYPFQNPIHQNYRHVVAVQRLLDFLPADAVKSVVVFAGEAEFRTEIPAGVFRLNDLIRYLGEQTTEVLSINRVQFCVGRLETARLALTGATDVKHVEHLERRFGRRG
jgi:Nuclease-related domain